AAIREVLRLDDAEGVDCLPNEEIFAELARMGYEKPSTKVTFYKAFFSNQWKFLIHTILQSLSAKRTSWNEFSSAMAFAVICLSTGRKFIFSKYIFDSLVRSVDRTSKFYMYPRFIQLLIRQQIGDLSTHTTKYTSPALTHKVFANMRRVGKGFSGVETPLFDGMLVEQVIEEGGDAEEHVKADTAAQGDDTTAHGDDAQEPSIPSPTPPTPPPQPPQDLPSTSQRIDTSEDTVMDDVSNQGRIIDYLDKDDVVTLMDDKEEDKKEKEAKEDEPAVVHEVVDVVTTAKLITEVVTAASIIVSATEPQVPTATITAAPVRVAAASSKRRKGVIMVEEPKPLKKKQHVKMDEEYARKLHAELNKDIDWDAAIDHVKQKAKEDPTVQRLDYFKGMSYDDIRPIFEVKFNSNMDFFLKTKEQMEEEESRALQSINKTPSQKAAKRRKLNKEVEDLKIHLEIVPDEDDDVYTEAIPLNFDREDLEALWNLVKERFSTLKPKNFSDDFLLNTLGEMFEKPDGQAQVWKNQSSIHGQAKVKSWKLLESCGEELSAAKQKLMLLDSAAEGRLMLLSQVKTVNDKYARSKPNGKMIVESIENGPYVRRMIATPREPDLPVLVPESFHEQTDEELTENDVKRMDVDDQAIQTILLGLPEDVFATVDSCETAKEIWERVRQMMKGSDIREQEKKAKLFNEWEKFTSTNNQQGYNAWQNGGIQVAQNTVQNASVQSSSNQNGLVVVPGIANQNGTGNVVAARAKGDLDKIEEVNANCILMANLQHASTSSTQLNKAPVYDTDGSAEVQLNDNCYDNEIFNMFTQEEQYTDLLEPIPEPQLVPQNDNHITSVAPSMVQSGGTIEKSYVPSEETRAHQETVHHNLVDQVAQVNTVNCNMRATNVELKSELARYKIQEKRVKISQEKYDKLEKFYQKSVYQEQCLTRKINALHLSSAKQITNLNDEISNLNKQLSREKSSISSLMEEKKKLRLDFKTQEDKYLDKEVDLEAKIKDLENIWLKKDQTVQTMYMLNHKPDLFFHP
nr:hypothetical protein [Tanacetum cinerariifolium]